MSISDFILWRYYNEQTGTASKGITGTPGVR